MIIDRTCPNCGNKSISFIKLAVSSNYFPAKCKICNSNYRLSIIAHFVLIFHYLTLFKFLYVYTYTDYLVLATATAIVGISIAIFIVFTTNSLVVVGSPLEEKVKHPFLVFLALILYFLIINFYLIYSKGSG